MEGAVTAYLLNLFDLACTLYALDMGAKELNPFMQSVPFMVFYKIVVVGGLLFWLASRSERVARKGIKACTVAYAALAVWHCVGISMMK